MGVRPGGRARRGGGGGPAGRRSGCTYWEELNPRGSSPEVGEEGEGEGNGGSGRLPHWTAVWASVPVVGVTGCGHRRPPHPGSGAWR